MFYIAFTKPVNSYVPGETVKGIIHLKLKKTIKASSIVLKIMGIGHANWSLILPKDTKRHQVYMDDSLVVWGNVNSDFLEVLDEGEHKIPFTFNLPMILPATIKGGTGYVRYFCIATINRHQRLNKTTKQHSFVVQDNRKSIGISMQNEIEKKEKEGLFDLKDALVKVFLTFRAGASPKNYMPGDKVKVAIEIDNNMKTQSVNGFTFYLKEGSMFGKPTQRCETLGLDSSNIIKYRIVKKEFMNLFVPPGTKGREEIEIVIPKFVPGSNTNSSVVQMWYEVEAKLNYKRGWKKNKRHSRMLSKIKIYPLTNLDEVKMSYKQELVKNEEKYLALAGFQNPPPPYEFFQNILSYRF